MVAVHKIFGGYYLFFNPYVPCSVIKYYILNTTIHEDDIFSCFYFLVKGMPTPHSNYLVALSDMLYIFLGFIVNNITDCCGFPFDPVEE